MSDRPQQEASPRASNECLFRVDCVNVCESAAGSPLVLEHITFGNSQ